MNRTPQIDVPLHQLRRARILRTAISGFVAKAAFFMSALIVSRIAIPQLGTERFGVLMTVLSLMSFLAVADLGVGSSLVTSLSRALGANDLRRVRQLQINGLVVVGAMSVVIGATSISFFFVDIGTLVFPSAGQEVRGEATIALGTFGILFALSLPLTLLGKIQLGLQLGHTANQWQAAAAVVNLAAGAFAALHSDSVPMVIVGLMVGTLLCGVANACRHFLAGDRNVRPTAAEINRKALSELLGDSIFYFVLQVVFTVTYAADTLIVARILGAEQASIFALAERVFSIVAVAVAVFSGPLWAAYGDAMGASDEKWATKTLWVTTIRIGAGSILVSCTILLFHHQIIWFLSNGRLEVPFELALAMASWRIVEAVGASLSVYLFARQAIKLALAMGIATAAASFAGKLLLLPQGGVVVVPIATTACYVVCCLVPSLYYVYKLQRQGGVCQ